MALTAWAGCPHKGVHRLDHRGWVNDGVRFHHQTLLCDACGQLVVQITFGKHEMAFQFPIASKEAVEALVRRSADRLHQEERLGPPPMPRPIGWLCPKCGKGFAPSVKQCETCGVEMVTAENKGPQKHLLTEGA